MSTLLDSLMMDMGEQEFLARKPRPTKQEEACQRIDEIDLGSVMTMLMLPKEHRGEGWGKQKAQNMERRYKMFLKLCVLYPKQSHVPTADIDHVWHWHILHTMQYRQDCMRVFGHYLDHNPREQTLEAEEKLRRGYEETKRLFRKEFRVKLPDYHTGDCSPFPTC